MADTNTPLCPHCGRQMPNRTYRTLTPEVRQRIWTMRYFGRRKQCDIAKELGITQGTVSRTCNDPRRLPWIKEQQAKRDVCIA